MSRQPSPTRKKPHAHALYHTSPQAPIQALRFIDQIDIYLWQASGDEAAVLDKIPATLTNAQQAAWYTKLSASVHPWKLTLSDIRRALLRDFGVDAKIQRGVLARYAEEPVYLRSQGFRLVVNYVDEIEALKEQVKTAAEAEAKWKKVLVKAERGFRAEMAEREKEVAGLREKVAELEMAVKGLTLVLGGGEGGRGLELAFARYQEEVRASGERFRALLAESGAGDAPENMGPKQKGLPDSYRRPETPVDSDEKDVSSGGNGAAVSKDERPLRQLLQNDAVGQRGKNGSMRIRGIGSQENKPRVHIDISDHPGPEDLLFGPGAIE